MITKYGYDVYFTIVVLCVVLIAVAIFFIDAKFLKYIMIILSGALFLFATNFFRDPERITPNQNNIIVAPADGKIIVIKKITENEFFKSDVMQISIFMSPLNVHVNRNPIDGTVKYKRYVEGEYFAAFEDKASEKNEQMIIGLEGKNGKVMFKQIAGFIARRIVCPLQIGDTVKIGERFGMIKFGSRVDVFVPCDLKICVQLGDITKAGETILCEYPKK